MTLLPGSVKSWLNGDFGSGSGSAKFKITPEISNQLDLHPASCTHHSFVSIVESAHKILWHKRNDRAKLKLRIDIRWLLSEFPPPTTMRELIRALNNSEWNGSIKATNGTFPFRVTHSDCLLVGVGEPDAEANMKRVVKYLEENGPVLGSFYPSRCYKPGRNTVYVSDHQRQTIECPECRRPLALRHAVCIVGTGTAFVVDKYEPCFQYIESENPKENSKNRDGICYMTMNSMHSVTLPLLR